MSRDYINVYSKYTMDPMDPYGLGDNQLPSFFVANERLSWLGLPNQHLEKRHNPKVLPWTLPISHSTLHISNILDVCIFVLFNIIFVG